MRTYGHIPTAAQVTDRVLPAWLHKSHPRPLDPERGGNRADCLGRNSQKCLFHESIEGRVLKGHVRLAFVLEIVIALLRQKVQ